MLHPIVSLLVRKPELAADHAAAYASLVQQEMSAAGRLWLRRLLAWVLFALAATTFCVLVGVAVMLGALHGSFHWALGAVPVAALALTGLAWHSARQAPSAEAFAELRAQIEADRQTLQQVSAAAA